MVDKKDNKIITLLKKNSRASIRKIAKETNIRPSTVHQRILKLIDNRIIEKFTVQLNDDAFHQSFVAFFLIKGTTQKYLSSKILRDDRVKEVYGITGEYDLLVKMKFKDVKDFNEYIITFRKNNPEIQSTLTMVGTAKIKEEL